MTGNIERYGLTVAKGIVNLMNLEFNNKVKKLLENV